MKIDKGLFQLDFTDHHAVLGLPVDADAKQVRKRYLKIARKLHPDSVATASDNDKRQASEFLSKLVNPAYEKLSQEKEFTEYNVVLRLKGQQLKQQPDTWQVSSDSACELLTSSNIEQLYAASLKALAEKQYESLPSTLEMIGQISELNLVYLTRKAAESQPVRSSAAATAATAPQSPQQSGPSAAASPAPQRRQNVIESYLNRAKEFEDKQDYNQAILELREALQSHPRNARCHHQLAGVYMRKSQPKMAKIHLAKVVELSPDSELAKSAQRRLENLEPTTSARGGGKGSSKGSDRQQPADKPRGGLFGLFGGKKS